MAKPAPPPVSLVSADMVSRRIVVDTADALLVKAVVEAHEGVAAIFGEERGVLIVASPTDREADLDALMLEITELLRTRHPT